MARTQFDLQDWLKDKSQKIETRDGRIVHNIWPVKEPLIVNGKKAEVCALIEGEEDALVFLEGGKYLPVNAESPFDLFIATDMSEFGMKVSEFAEAYKLAATDCESEEYKTCNGNLQLIIDKYAAELLALAEKEIAEGHEHSVCIPEDTYHAQLQKHFDTGYDMGKAEALKDLPRWKKVGRGNNYSAETKFTINGRYLEMNDTLNDVYEVPLSALEKLPRFKED